ncbi:YihY/virulence factor BrkB family protein [Loigolactobacillus backii]|uniref:YihY/virulence factor BrkB family protein n=1 Tax=Loigolactobacillus backii TaxID=375175 RepID=UPI000B1D26D3|nr:YihY/virulence factor BrkB family protein [Loigolactobacillus backii]MDA5388121.1 YihY/virulence factor BrkB family protein [Loigolactobacillus backii]MDA5390613.1 YihY/virulence factor BrkB family protein [Loigolactobacillus backii]
MAKKIKKSEQSTFRRFISIFIDRFTHAGINDGAVVIAYWELLSLFPLLIFLGNLMPLLHINGQNISRYAEAAIPSTLYQHLWPLMHSFVKRGSGGLLSIGVVGTLWAASRGVNALKRMMDRTYGVLEGQNFLIIRLMALVMTLFLMLALVVLIFIFSFGQEVLTYLAPRLDWPVQLIDAFKTFKLPVTFTVVFVMLTLIYFILPNVHLRLRSVLPGALIATAGWLGLAQLFSLYVRYFAHAVLDYGTLGLFVVLMLWLDFAAWISMFGAVINVVVEQTLYGEVRKSSRIQDLISRQRAGKS